MVIDKELLLRKKIVKMNKEIENLAQKRDVLISELYEILEAGE